MLRRADGTCKLADFGLAIDTRCDVPVSRVGTLEYMAPELVCLDKDLPELYLRLLRVRRQAQYCDKVGPTPQSTSHSPSFLVVP